MHKIVISGLVALVISSNAMAEASGAAFLKIPNGAAEISLGMSGVSHSRGGSAAFWNPARAGIGGDNLGLQFFRWLGDGRGTFGTASFETTWGGLSAYLFDLGIDDFEARERPGPAASTFTVHQSVIAVTAAVNMPMDMRVGLTMKGYLEDIYGDVANQFPLLDAGVSWSGGKWSAGLVGANMPVNNRMDNPPPMTARVGVSRKDYLGDYSLMDVVEYSAVRDQKGTAHLGLEGGYKERFFVRGGAAVSGDFVRPTFGLGFESGPYRVDAAMALYDQALGSTWRVGLGYGI